MAQITGGPNLDYSDYMALRRAEGWRAVRWVVLVAVVTVAVAVWYLNR